MKSILLTRERAFASGYDAANQQMRRANRKAWNPEDAALAARTTNRLLTYVPVSEGGLEGIPREVLERDGLL